MKKSIIELSSLKPNSTVMVYDVHASESGALAILDDLYKQIKEYPDKSIKWVFIISTPRYEETNNIVVRRFPWVKKNWGYRYWFDTITARRLVKGYNPDKVISLQNKGLSFYHKEQIVYLHLPFILTEHKFKIKEDGKRLWVYQNIISKSIFRSLCKVDKVIVQTQWMKDALIKKGNVDESNIFILQPDVTLNNIGVFKDTLENRKRFFYPATAFSYKNHITALKAIDYAQKQGLDHYDVIFTMKEDENKYTKELSEYARKHNINVNFIGKISRSEVFDIYTKSVLLFPSYVESFGLPLLEAKLTGCYIVASDCSFCREILEEYDRAMFCSKMDFEQMGREILKIVNQ